MRFLCLLVCLLVTQNGVLQACPVERTTVLRFHPTTKESVRGVVLHVPGLNNNDTIFAAIEDALARDGYHNVIVTLAGHEGSEADKHCATPDAWLKNIADAARYIAIEYPDLPVYGIGFSLGGVVLTAALAEEDAPLIKRLVLLAPALSVRTYTQAVRAFFPLSSLSFSLPSMAPEQYSAYSSTSVQSYQSLFRMQSRALKSLAGTKQVPPAYVLVHAYDELVSPSGLQEMIEEHALSDWQLVITDMQKELSGYNYHHIFAPEAFAQKQWNSYLRAILEFLDAGSSEGG